MEVNLNNPIHGGSQGKQSVFRARIAPYLLNLLLLLLLFTLSGCMTASEYRLDADKSAERIITEKQRQLLGGTEDFSIERPSDILRRRLLLEQDLPYSGDASLGTDMLKPVDHWPEEDYPKGRSLSDRGVDPEAGKSLRLSLIQSLQAGACNSSEYQAKKEDLFRSALSLDLERNDFGFTLKGQAETSASVDKSGSGSGGPGSGPPGSTGSTSGGDGTVKGVEHSGSLGVSKLLQDGSKLTAALAVDLVSLLTQGRTSSFGIVGDASISIPLLRGSGRHIVTEPMTQAERDVVYAMYEFERYKKRFAVDIAGKYLDVLKQLDQVANAAENYRNLIASARRTRRLADAGRATEIEVDQAVQKELSARNRWVSTMELYESRLDTFKKLIGLPVDADIGLDRHELDRLAASTSKIMVDSVFEEGSGTGGESLSADEDIELLFPGRENAGPLEMDEALAIDLGLENRLDLRVVLGKVYDAQRSVVVLADALRAELTLFGEAELGESRSLSTAGLDDARLRTGRGIYTGLFKLDLPLERTAERNAYRAGFIALERAVRDVQKIEDEIKLSIRKELREMSEAREGLRIQTMAVFVAEKRVKSTDLFFEAGRAQLRDLLEAQEALLNAKNGRTAAMVDYRVAELEFQRDTGLLNIDKDGLFQEYSPEVTGNVKR